MSRITSYLLLYLLLLSVVQAQQPQSDLIPTYPSGTKVQLNQIETTEFPKVKLYATVTRSGLPLGGLTARNFRVREDDNEQVPIRVYTERDAISAVILLDVSGSMKNSIAQTKAAAIGFLKTLNENDKVEVITFHEQIATIYPLGSDFAAATNAINQIRHRGDTALYDGIYTAIKSLENVSGRRAVIVLSDGIDDDGYGNQLSKNDLDRPLMLAIQTNIPLYTIGLGSNMDAGILKTFAGTTGAEYTNAPTREELDELYAKIGQQLSNQYTIEYTTSNPQNGGLREVKLDLLVPSKKPYAAPEPVLDDVGRVISYKAPKLNDKEIGRLAQMAGVGDFARENEIKSLEKFVEEIADQWPENLPSYSKAKSIVYEEAAPESSKRSFHFKTTASTEDFNTEYIQTLKDKDWFILSQTKTGNLSFFQAYRGEANMAVGVQELGDDTKVNIEYHVPEKNGIVIEQDNSNQIIAADGRDVTISGTDGIVIITGGCGELTLTGASNQIQCDAARKLIISGDENVVVLGSLDSATITGKNNEVAWGKGSGGSEPAIEDTGTDNKVQRLE